MKVLLLSLLFLGGCRLDMHDTPRYEPLESSELFRDGMSERQPVEGTVARGTLVEDEHLHEGTVDGELAATLPFALTRSDLERGQERFDIYCSPCHGRLGDGRGMIVQRGMKRPTSFHDPRLRAQPIAYFFNVMTNGFGVMFSYAPSINPKDRWRIAAYIRALQLSQHADIEDVPADARSQLN